MTIDHADSCPAAVSVHHVETSESCALKFKVLSCLLAAWALALQLRDEGALDVVVRLHRLLDVRGREVPGGTCTMGREVPGGTCIMGRRPGRCGNPKWRLSRLCSRPRMTVSSSSPSGDNHDVVARGGHDVQHTTSWGRTITTAQLHKLARLRHAED